MEDRVLFTRQHLRGCQLTTRAMYERMAGYFMDWLSEEDIELSDATVEIFDAFVDEKQWASKTIHACLSAIKAYLRGSGKEEHPLLKLSVPKHTERHRRIITEERKNQVLHACRDLSPAMAIRNKAIVELLWCTGIRRFELANALLEDLDFDTIFLSVMAKAKNKKGRRLQKKKLSPKAVQALKEWLAIRSQIADRNAKTLFVSQTGTPLTGDGVACIFKRISKKIGFTVSPHQFRGGMATHSINRGLPDRLVMQQGGWDCHEVFKHYTEQASLEEYGRLMGFNKDEDGDEDALVPVR